MIASLNLANLLLYFSAILVFALIVGMVGYVVGRTFVQEEIFKGTRESNRFKKLFFNPYPPVYKKNFVLDEESNERVETGLTLGYIDDSNDFKELDLSLYPGDYVDNRRIDIGSRRAFFLMKIGDMLSCPYCLSAEVTLWLAIIISVVASMFVGPSLIILLSGVLAGMVGVCYTYWFNDFLNKRNSESNRYDDDELEVETIE